MTKTKDYDDQLVQLLARGELSDREIAGRLGLSPTQVSRIARGESRPDLQPKINAVMRQTLKDAWKNGGRLDTDSGEASPATLSDGERSRTTVAGKSAQTAFDRHLAVELIAAGQLTLAQIARRLGIHKTAAWRIATGRSHGELQPLIREAQQHYRDRARRIGTKWSAQIVMKQIQVGLKDNGWVGLRARQDLLDRFLGPEDDSDRNAPVEDPPFITEMNKLPKALRNQVIEALGGPAADEGPDEYVHWNDPSTWRPVGAAAETDAPVETAVAEDATQEDAATPQKNDVAQPPSAEPFDEAPSTALRTSQGKQAQAPPTAERCSRNKERRNRRRREDKSFLR